MLCSYVFLGFSLITTSITQHEAHAFSTRKAKEINPEEAQPLMYGLPSVKYLSKRSATEENIGAYKAPVDSSPLADPIQVGAYKADVDSSPLVDLIQDESIGSPSETTQLSPRRRRRKKSQMCPKKYSCADCSTVRICGNRANGSLVETKVKCQSETPFCNERTGTCDSEPGRLDLCGDMINSTFVCQTDGFYPNPETTNKFYLCFQGYAFSLSCNKNQRFNLDKNMCTNNQNTLFYDEIVFDCQKLHGVKVKHTQYDRFYAFCIDGVPSMVDKCGVNYRFDFDSQSCLPSNHDSSLLVYIPDVRDCSKYYTKFRDQDVITTRMCAPGFYFDYFMASCVPDSSVCLDKDKYNI